MFHSSRVISGQTQQDELAACLANCRTTDFCLEAVSEAMARFGKPEIFNTDQGTFLKRAGMVIELSRPPSK